jgi:hypothetical protein
MSSHVLLPLYVRHSAVQTRHAWTVVSKGMRNGMPHMVRELDSRSRGVRCSLPGRLVC